MNIELAKQVLRIKDLSEASASFKSLSKQYHPDKPGGDEEKFKELNDAYSFIQNYIKNGHKETYTEKVRSYTDDDFYRDVIMNEKRKQRQRNKKNINSIIKISIPDFYIGLEKSYSISYIKNGQTKTETITVKPQFIRVLNFSLPNDTDTTVTITIIPENYSDNNCEIYTDGLNVIMKVKEHVKEKPYWVSPIKGIVITPDTENFTMINKGLSNGTTRGEFTFIWN